MRLINRTLNADVRLFEPEASPEGCASGECIPEPVARLVLLPSEPDEPESEPEPEPEAPAPIATVLSDADRWAKAVEAVRLASPRHGKALSYARFLGFSPEGVKIAFPTDAAFHRSQVTGMGRNVVEAELTRSLGRTIRIVEDTSAGALQSAPKSIAEVEATDRSTREKGIEDKIRAHPALRNVMRHLGGSLEHVSYLEPIAKPARPAGPDENDTTTPQAD